MFAVETFLLMSLVLDGLHHSVEPCCQFFIGLSVEEFNGNPSADLAGRRDLGIFAASRAGVYVETDICITMLLID